MGYEPKGNILPDYWGEGDQLKETLGEFADTIEECVNFGTHVHEWVHHSFKGEKDYPTPLLLLIRHSLELGLAISGLVRLSLIDPAKLQVRALFESQLSILYLLEDNFKTRSYAFLTTLYIKRKKLHEKLHPETEVGKQFKTEMEGTALEDLEISHEFNLEKAIKNLESLLQVEGFSQATEQYKKRRELLRKSHQSMRFFMLYDDITNIKELSEHLGMKADYEIIYRDASKKVHASDVVTGYLAGEKSDEWYFIALKDPGSAQHVTLHTIRYLLNIYKSSISKFCPGRSIEYYIWYKDNIESKYNDLATRKIININN